MTSLDYIVRFTEWESPPLTANQRHPHWAVEAKLKKQVRGKTLELTQHFPAMKRISVQLTWWVNDRRRRDTDNLWPTLKACCDGLVDAGLVPDDTPEFMDKPQPQIVYVKKQVMPAHVELFIREIA